MSSGICSIAYLSSVPAISPFVSLAGVLLPGGSPLPPSASSHSPFAPGRPCPSTGYLRHQKCLPETFPFSQEVSELLPKHIETICSHILSSSSVLSGTLYTPRRTSRWYGCKGYRISTRCLNNPLPSPQVQENLRTHRAFATIFGAMMIRPV